MRSYSSLLALYGLMCFWKKLSNSFGRLPLLKKYISFKNLIELTSQLKQAKCCEKLIRRKQFFGSLKKSFFILCEMRYQAVEL